MILDDKNVSRLLSLYGEISDIDELSKIVNSHLSVVIDEIEEDELDGKYKDETIIKSNIMEENDMTKELSIESIKRELMDALVGDMRIITSFTNKEKKATDYIGNNIFNYLDDIVDNICRIDTYINFDVNRLSDKYDIVIQLKMHRDMAVNKDSKHVNCLDALSKYIEEIVNELYPYRKLYSDISVGCINRHIRRNIRFALFEDDAKNYQKLLEYRESK